MLHSPSLDPAGAHQVDEEVVEVAADALRELVAPLLAAPTLFLHG